MDAAEREQWREADRLFARLIELDEPDREQLLASWTLPPALHDKLQLMLGASRRRHELLDAPPALPLAGAVPDRIDPLLGRQVGDWHLLELLGRGGMAAVYRAERIGGDYRQVAAVKLLSLVLNGAADHARFRRERMILARLQHPHIARLLDGGIDPQGTPYLVMSLVDGERIDTWCEQRQLPLPARVRLLLQVCAAVAYAHRQLVVHRDIKPSNILVDADGHACLLDFGIARLLDASDGSSTHCTRAFTPDYAAPEQRAGNLPPSTAIDVYGLGAMLHRLLTGRPPQADAHGEPLPASSVARAAGHPLHARALAGDLDAILGCALASDPGQRYPAVDALAADLHAWLDHRPIHARRQGRWQRLRKLVRRNRLASALALLCLAATLVAGGAVLRSEWQARAQARELQAVVTFQTDMLKGIDPQALGSKLRLATAAAIEPAPASAAAALEQMDFTGIAVDLLDHAVLAPATRAVDARFAQQPRVRAALLQTLADSYGSLLRLDDAARLQDTATALFEATDGPAAPHTLASLRARARLAVDAHAAGGEALVREVLARHERARGPAAVETAQARALLGEWLLDTDPVQAEGLLREALARIEAVHGGDTAEALVVRGALATALASQDRFAEAEPLYRRTIEQARVSLGAHDPRVLEQVNALAWTLARLGRNDEAHALYRQVYEAMRSVFGEHDPRTLNVLNNLAAWPRRRGDHATAEPMQREAWQGMRAAVGADHPATLRLQANLAEICLHRGQLDEATDLLVDALQRWSRRTEQRPLARLQRLLAQTQLARGERTQAAHTLQQAWQSAQQAQLVDEQRATASALVELYRAQPSAVADLRQWQARLQALPAPATSH